VAEQLKNPPSIIVLLNVRIAPDAPAGWREAYAEHLSQDLQRENPTRTTRETFVDRQANYRVGVQRALVSIRQDPPYPSWDALRLRLRRHLAGLADRLGTKHITQISLSYHNSINIETEHSPAVADYFRISPSVDESFGDHFEAFMIGLMRSVSENSKLRIELMSSEPPSELADEVMSSHLVLVYITQNRKFLRDLPIEDWLEDAHDTIETNFFDLLTPRATRLLRGEGSE
jgi:uncharacterized protein (TIGR04255 family)